ncbi:hypothetical protein V565_202270 [Rhizoctonia solani 123E]|uniref:Uncharacterized protein n=1 Tax=Rhizoctonia solani 123E TaxID=1423351 RepID=A0A074RGY8_9AGAM|nr:hypothetical protein V565_202270 [Rhizoctonia solani 123E]
MGQWVLPTMHWILGELHAGDVVDQLANNLLLPLDFPPRRWYSFLCFFHLIALVHNGALDQSSSVRRPPIRDLLLGGPHFVTGTRIEEWRFQWVSSALESRVTWPIDCYQSGNTRASNDR